MFAKDVELGKCYLGRLYGRLTVIRIDQVVERHPPLKGTKQVYTSWLATNLRSGKAFHLKNAKTLQSLATDEEIRFHTMTREELRDYLSTVRVRPATDPVSPPDGNEAEMLHEVDQTLRWINDVSNSVFVAQSKGWEKCTFEDLRELTTLCRLTRDTLLRLALKMGIMAGLSTDHLTALEGGKSPEKK